MENFGLLKEKIDRDALSIKKQLSDRNTKGELDILSFLGLISKRPLLREVESKIFSNKTLSSNDTNYISQQKYIKKAQNFQTEVINYMKNEILQECLSLANQSSTEAERFSIIKRDWKKFRKYFMNNIKLHDDDLSRRFVFLECLFRLLLVWHEKLDNEASRRNLRLIDHLIGLLDLQSIFKDYPETKQLLQNQTQRHNQNNLLEKKDIKKEDDLQKANNCNQDNSTNELLNCSSLDYDNDNIHKNQTTQKKLKVTSNFGLADSKNKEVGGMAVSEVNNENDENLVNQTSSRGGLVHSTNGVQSYYNVASNKTIASLGQTADSIVQNMSSKDPSKNNIACVVTHNTLNSNQFINNQSSSELVQNNIFQSGLSLSNQTDHYLNNTFGKDNNDSCTQQDCQNQQQHQNVDKSHRSLTGEELKQSIDYDASFLSEKTSSAFSFENSDEFATSQQYQQQQAVLNQTNSYDQSQQQTHAHNPQQSQDSKNYEQNYNNNEPYQKFDNKKNEVDPSTSINFPGTTYSKSYQKQGTTNHFSGIRQQAKLLINSHQKFITNESQGEIICGNIEAQLFSRYHHCDSLYKQNLDDLLNGLIFTNQNMPCKTALLNNYLDFDKIVAFAQEGRKLDGKISGDKTTQTFVDKNAKNIDIPKIIHQQSQSNIDNTNNCGVEITFSEIIEGLKEDENVFLQGLVNKLRKENDILKKTMFELRLQLNNQDN